MNDVAVSTRSGARARLDAAAIERLRGTLRGPLLLPGEPGYDEARTVWNAMIDRRPALVARCAGATDVRRAVGFARDHDLLLAVKGGGHNIGGNAVCDGGLLVDLSAMRTVRIDPDSRRAVVDPGATLRDLDDETQAFGLAVPLGINSTTGVAGLTLGGGFGWVVRKLGMTIDNLVSAEVVTAAGERVRASETENPDLFWALRGGGGNFGVVTAFEFALHPLGPELFSGLVVHPFERGRELLERYREFAEAAPDELTCWAVLRKAPPLPFLPESVHGREVVVFALCHAGNPADGERAAAEIRSWGEPHGAHVGVQPYAAWQQAFDPLLTPGARNYWKSHDFVRLGDEAIEQILDYAGRLPTPECEIFVAHMGGAMARVDDGATAFPQRKAHHVLNVHTRWRDPAQDEECIGWARAFFDATAPFAAGTVYVNFMPEDEGGKVERAYGANWSRLIDAKRRWDPENLFRVNQNVPPGG